LKRRWLVVALVAALLAGLTYFFEWSPYFPDRSPLFVTPGPDNVTLKFPDHFYWGVSLSGTQAESQQASDWAAFERDVAANHRFNAGKDLGTTEPGNIRNFGKWSEQVRSQKSAFDTFYRQDIAMASEMGINAFRISFEWARLFPRADMTEPSPEGIAYYKAVIAEMKRNRITPFVTLYHYVSPQWFFQADPSGKRGWERQDALMLWQRYIDAVAQNFIPDVEQWCTLNEPMVYLYNAYVQGVYPPLEKRDLSAIDGVYEALLRAHAAAYQTMHKVAVARKATAIVGLTMSVSSFAPLRRWAPIDRLTARFVEQTWNWEFLDAIQTGRMNVVVTGADRTIPGLKGTQDYVGINYYARNYVKGNLFHPTSFETFERDPVANEPHSEMGWTNYPLGLYDILFKASAKYRKPIYVLENGTCDGDDDDEARQQYLLAHVREVWQAINNGVNVRSYFVWSFVDNLEWVDGFDARFGLLAVDYENNFMRTPRPSATLYAEIIRNNGLTPEMMKPRRQ
jgi:beta-glucosidase